MKTNHATGGTFSQLVLHMVRRTCRALQGPLWNMELWELWADPSYCYTVLCSRWSIGDVHDRGSCFDVCLCLRFLIKFLIQAVPDCQVGSNQLVHVLRQTMGLCVPWKKLGHPSSGSKQLLPSSGWQLWTSVSVHLSGAQWVNADGRCGGFWVAFSHRSKVSPCG